MPPQGTMPPPGEKPSLAIAIGVPKGKGPTDEPEDPQPGGKKHSEAEAHVVRADQHCGQCENYQGESGECKVVEGSFEPDDACIRYFEPMGDDETEPDADDAGGPPDMDADDMGGVRR